MPFKFDHAFYVWSISPDTQALIIGHGENGVLYTVAVGDGKELVLDESLHVVALCACRSCETVKDDLQKLIRGEAKAIAIL